MLFLMQSSWKSREEVYCTVKPRYMREKRTPKIGLYNKLAYKRPRITINYKIGSRKRPFLNCIYAKLQIKRPHTRAACTVKPRFIAYL